MVLQGQAELRPGSLLAGRHKGAHFAALVHSEVPIVTWIGIEIVNA